MAGSLPIDFGGLVDLAKNIYSTQKKFFVDAGVPEFVAIVISGTNSGLLMLLPAAIAVVVQGVLGVGTFVAVQFLGLIDDVRKNNASDFNAVIAASANELLGTNITADQLTSGSGSGSSMDQNKAIGDALISVFEQGLGNLSPLTPEQGAENARKFAGFAINFGMSQGFLSILTEATSVGFLKEFHELPEGLKGALGLGRLQRAALAPLVRNCISQPYDLYLKNLLRPDRLSEGQIVHALKSGKLSDADARQALAEKGYRDSDIDLLITDLAEKIQLSELFTLVRYGDLTQDQAIQKLTDAGMDADQAKLALKALSEQKADSLVAGILADLETAFAEGFIDQGLYNATLDKLPLSDDEDAMFRLKVGLHQERTRKRITFAQLKTGIIEGIVDFSYMDQWLAAEGYSAEDQLILSYEILQALKTAEEKAAAKPKVAKKATAAGKTVPPPLAG